MTTNNKKRKKLILPYFFSILRFNTRRVYSEFSFFSKTGRTWEGNYTKTGQNLTRDGRAFLFFHDVADLH